MISINQLSQDVGIGVDTLRIWERRYGYPTPRRDQRGHRSYTEEQREELRIVRKLQDLGERPGKIFALSPQQRRDQLEKRIANLSPDIDSLRQLAIKTPVVEIAVGLRTLLRDTGLVRFIHETADPLLQILGYGWAKGNISIAREHFISDVLEDILRLEIRRQELPDNAPRLLFLTLSGERHRLGLLLAAALFQQQGCKSLLIQEDLPLDEVPVLAEELAVDGVALSFSSHYPATQAKKDLVSLRELLAAKIELIAGGQVLGKSHYLLGIQICAELKDIPEIHRRAFGTPPETEKKEQP